jgi:predicted TIM-barrel fold metal-dependent hydrolase
MLALLSKILMEAGISIHRRLADQEQGPSPIRVIQAAALIAAGTTVLLVPAIVPARGAAQQQPFIDVHVHIFADASTTIEQRLAMNFDRAADQAIAHMDKNKVRVSVIMPTPGVRALVDSRVLFAQAKRYPTRLVLLAGGGTLNPIIQKTSPADVTEQVKRDFEAKAESLLRQGAVGFGEMAALHFSYFRFHPFEEVQPDHPLFLLLADIAARHNVPIDLHCEIVPHDMAVSPKLIRRSAKNPPRVHANLAALERLLNHNPRAQIVLSHSTDATGFRKAAIIRGLIERHPNLAMSLNPQNRFLFLENMPLKGTGGINRDWLRLIKDHPDRFMIGSDQRYSEPCPTCRLVERVASSRRWIDLLPPDIARKIAVENPVRIYHLTLKR